MTYHLLTYTPIKRWFENMLHFVGGGVSTWAQFGLQDAASPVIEEYLYFHDFALVVLVFIVGVVRYILGLALTNRGISTGILEGQIIEALWTALPALVLIQIAIPSLLLLYSLDEGADCQITVKTIGHQWYWSYEYSDFGLAESGRGLEFDSYILGPEGRARLLDVDNRVAIPWGTGVRVLVGSADVLHSWALPRLGVKVDACPGRLNQVKVIRHRPGVFFGQCSEICGANHRFMPIVIEAVGAPDFLGWLSASLEESH